MSRDPRVPKSRLAKAYTDQQLLYLRSHLPEFERRSQGTTRGDAKKFAIERASDFILRFGLPDEFIGVEEPESRFKEQIYNWFKNTIGRTRRKLEGRLRSGKKAPDKSVAPDDLGWSSNVVPADLVPYSQATSRSPAGTPQSLVTPVQYGAPQANSPLTPAIPPPPPVSHAMTVTMTQHTLRDAFLQGVIPSTLASMIQALVMSNTSPIPLTPVVEALFDAISADSNSASSYNRDPHLYLQRYLDASAYFPNAIIHAGIAGPMAGPRALQMHIRKYSTWMPTLPGPSTSQRASGLTTSQSTSSLSISDEMHRIASDRQRRKDYIQWARIHAAALELGMMGMGLVNDGDTNYSYAIGRAFSDMLSRDLVWEADEVEWVAGICILRAAIRTAMRGDRGQRDMYDELLRSYEDRWKEIKDEVRQALVTDILISAKEALARLDE